MNRAMRLLFALLVTSMIGSAFAQKPPANTPRPLGAKHTFQPSTRPVTAFQVLDFRAAAAREKTVGTGPAATEIEEIEAPQPPPSIRKGVPIIHGGSKLVPQATPPTGLGPSPAPSKTFKAEFLSATSIPPDTMGAVGATHIVTVTNDRMRILTRDGIELSRLTLTSFWAGVTIKGAAISAFDPKVYWDRFNNRFILISSGNGQTVNSGAMFAVTATNDPTGTWYRWSVAADATSTAAGGHWIDYPTVGHNKNWIVIDDNVFNFGTATPANGFWGTQIYVLDKQAAYANTLSTINVFEGDFNNVCLTSATPETELACGFTMAPAITEDNTTDTDYLVEDWDNINGQLRLSKITGTPSAPVLTVGTQFPQSPNTWRFDAARLGTANNCGGTCSGGYMPQRQQSANLVSGTRIMANDSRIQNAVFRGTTLWTVHTVMLSATAQAAGVTIGGAGNPVDTHSGIDWWQIDPTIETGLSTAPLQLGRIEDPSADNCHNGQGGTNAAGPRCTSTATQKGEFYAFPNISVNQSNDVYIGFTRFSPLTYPNSAYCIRRAADPANTTRDPVVFRPGQSNYNIGGGSGTARQNRWGDYSSAQTDPLNDTDFWSVQEYAGANRNDFLAPSYAGPWETWWALVSPTGPTPSAAGTLIISEFRLRGPAGPRDEYVELYNPGSTPVIVNTTDGSDGWALGFSTNGVAITGVAVVPNGTVIKPHGHFLITDNPDNVGGTSAVVYSLNGAPSSVARGADSDTGWAFDLADNGGVALFNTANTANFAAGTRLDSAGFASIAAGLFKEGAGIPAVTATTPAGQMTFMRILSSGVPQDTGANENDFIFVDPVLETLGVTPKLGAAGPENLSSPINQTGATFPSALLDAGIPAAYAPNVFRDPTAGPVATSTFGTISFRRTFTNNTGADLQQLRFRIVDTTTNPPGIGAADLRALASSNTTLPLSGGGTASVGGTTLEQPPAQAAGGGFNGTLNVGGVAIATPLLAGSSVSLQFTAGVQVNGTYNFCLVPEGDTATAAAPLCFTGNTLNTNPSITPGGPLARSLGESASSTIATVSDVEDAAGTLVVTATSVPAGIIVTSISNAAGTVTATVAASCTATVGANNVTLQVADSQGGLNTATLVVNVSDPGTPTITPGGPTTFCAGGSVLLTSSAASGNQWNLNGNPIGGATNTTYSATASGSYTVVLFGCPAATSAATVVTVNPIPATPTITPGGPTTFCAGGSVMLTSSSASGNQWNLNGNPIGGATNQNYSATASGNYTVIVTTLGCSSAASAITTVTVNPIPATPTITPGGPTTFCAGGSVTLTSSSASGNQWYSNGNPIGGATNQAFIATVAADYTVIVTTLGCSSSASAATTVTVNPNPNATITAPAAMPTGTSAGASVANAGVGATYVWGITNGSITSGAGTASITFTAGAVGTTTLNVTVTTAANCSDTKSANVTVNASTITVTSVVPGSGRITGGSPITINGTGFVNGATVTVGGNAATSVVFISSIKLTAHTPAHAAGQVNVTVTNPDTTNGTLTNGFTYIAQQFDANGDGAIDPSDIFLLVDYLFDHGPAPLGPAGMLSGDANGDGNVDPADIFYVVNYLFTGGPAPFSTPFPPRVTTAVDQPFRGALSLGEPATRNGRTYVPVILTMASGSPTPQAIALKLLFGSALPDARIHRAGVAANATTSFEISRPLGKELSYLVAFDQKNGGLSLSSGGARSTVIAEVEVPSSQALNIDFDPAVTILSDASGTHTATVANGTLQVSGIESAQRPGTKRPGIN